MSVYFPVLLFFISISVGANSIQWIPGVIVLQDESVKAREISPQTADVVLFRNSSGGVTVYPAYQVRSFRYHDAVDNINRVFVSLKNSHSHFKSYRFYESVVTGWINVFRKVRNNAVVISESRADEFVYYIAWGNQWVALKNFRQLIYPFIRQSERTSPHLLKELKGLNPNRCDEALKIIILYNRNYAGTSMAGI